MINTSTLTEINWDEYARCYDALCTLNPYQKMMGQIVGIVPRDSKSILDLGCGTGTLLSILTKRLSAKFTGLDNSPQMLSIAKKKLANKNVALRRCNLESDADWGGPYDCIVSTNVLYTLSNPLLFLTKVRDNLSINGIFILVTPKAGYDNGLILKSHCNDTREDKFWRDPHKSLEREQMLIKEALGNTPLARQMELVAKYNRQIAGTKKFFFFAQTEITAMFIKSHLKLIHTETSYADQNFLMVLTKENKNEN